MMSNSNMQPTTTSPSQMLRRTRSRSISHHSSSSSSPIPKMIIIPGPIIHTTLVVNRWDAEGCAKSVDGQEELKRPSLTTTCRTAACLSGCDSISSSSSYSSQSSLSSCSSVSSLEEEDEDVPQQDAVDELWFGVSPQNFCHTRHNRRNSTSCMTPAGKALILKQLDLSPNNRFVMAATRRNSNDPPSLPRRQRSAAGLCLD